MNNLQIIDNTLEAQDEMASGYGKSHKEITMEQLMLMMDGKQLAFVDTSGASVFISLKRPL